MLVCLLPDNQGQVWVEHQGIWKNESAIAACQQYFASLPEAKRSLFYTRHTKEFIYKIEKHRYGDELYEMRPEANALRTFPIEKEADKEQPETDAKN